MGEGRPSSHTAHLLLDSQIIHMHPTKKANTISDIDAIDMRDLRLEILKQ